MIEIPTGLPAELVPLSWLLGVWEGTGVLDYSIGERRVQH
ncbi:MAG: FABP family protein, partial [Microbacteriaceae bacterium]